MATVSGKKFQGKGGWRETFLAGRAFIKSHLEPVDNAVARQWFTSFLTRAEGQFGDRLFPPIRR
jgi:hypothetical protein